MTDHSATSLRPMNASTIAAADGLARRLLPSLLAVGVLLPVGLGLNYFLNVILARTLAVADYGIYAFSISLASVLALGVSLGFSQSMMRLVPACRARGKSGQLAGLLQGSFRVVVLCALLLALLLFTAGYSDTGRELGGALFWTALLVPVLAIDLWRESTMRGLHRSAEAILPRQVLLPLIVVALVVLLEPRSPALVLTIYLGIFIALEISGLYRLYRQVDDIRGAVPVSDLGNWLKVSIPMGLAALASQGMRNWDIVLVGVLAGMDASGLYTAAARTALLASLILRALNLVAGPVLAELYHGQDYRRFKKLFAMSLVGTSTLGIPLYVLVLVFAPDILGLFGAGYAEAATLLRILATGELFNLITGPAGLVLMMTKHERSNMLIVMTAAGLSLCALAILVPAYGVTGAAIATAAATIFLNCMQCGCAFRFIYRRPTGPGLVRDAVAS